MCLGKTCWECCFVVGDLRAWWRRDGHLIPPLSAALCFSQDFSAVADVLELLCHREGGWDVQDRMAYQNGIMGNVVSRLQLFDIHKVGNDFWKPRLFQIQQDGHTWFDVLLPTCHPDLACFWSLVPLNFWFTFSSFSSICCSNLSLSKQVCWYNNFARDLAISNSVFAHFSLASLLISHLGQ